MLWLDTSGDWRRSYFLRAEGADFGRVKALDTELCCFFDVWLMVTVAWRCLLKYFSGSLSDFDESYETSKLWVCEGYCSCLDLERWDFCGKSVYAALTGSAELLCTNSVSVILWAVTWLPGGGLFDFLNFFDDLSGLEVPMSCDSGCGGKLSPERPSECADVVSFEAESCRMSLVIKLPSFICWFGDMEHVSLPWICIL